MLEPLVTSLEPQCSSRSEEDHAFPLRRRPEIADRNDSSSTSCQIDSDDFSHSRFSNRLQETVSSQTPHNLTQVANPQLFLGFSLTHIV